LKTDLDIYLEDDVFISESENGDDNDANFDALVWWKSNALKYHILSKMARDLLKTIQRRRKNCTRKLYSCIQ
jgi:hypothetical protein